MAKRKTSRAMLMCVEIMQDFFVLKRDYKSNYSLKKMLLKGAKKCLEADVDGMSALNFKVISLKLMRIKNLADSFATAESEERAKFPNERTQKVRFFSESSSISDCSYQLFSSLNL